MKLHIEIEFEADYHEDTDGDLHLRGLRKPGLTQNWLPMLSEEEQLKARAELLYQHNQAILAKAQAVQDRNAAACDAYVDARKESRWELMMRGRVV